MHALSKPRLWSLQLLFGWMNLALAVPGIYLMFGLPLEQIAWTIGIAGGITGAH